MLQVLVVIHLLIAIALILLILVQKNEGGASGGGFSVTASVSAMSQVRPRANPLSRITTILGICFFATSLGLALMAKPRTASNSLFAPQVEGPAVPKIGDIPTPDTGDAAASPSQGAGEPSTPQAPAVPNN